MSGGDTVLADDEDKEEEEVDNEDRENDDSDSAADQVSEILIQWQEGPRSLHPKCI